MRIFTFLCTVFVLVCVSIQAQAPQGFKYQALIRDSEGKSMVNQEVGIRINIQQDSSGGTVVYSETHSVTTGSSGLVNLVIGNGSYVSGNFNQVDWSLGNYFVQVEVDKKGGSNYQLVGESKLFSVPYALYSESSGTSGSNTASDWKKSGNDIYYDEGKVGIGMIPTHAFNVKDENSILGFKDQPGSTSLMVGNKSDGIAGLYLDAADGDFSGSDYFIIHQDDNLDLNIESMYHAGDIKFMTKPALGQTPEKESMRITKAGKVGIGTNDPSSILSLESNISSGIERNMLKINNLSEGNLAYSGILFKTGTSGGQSVLQDYGLNYLGSSSYDFAGFFNISNSTKGIMLHANSAKGIIKFYTGHDATAGAGIERMRIDTNGNVGIGTSEPNATLDVAGFKFGGPQGNMAEQNNIFIVGGSIPQIPKSDFLPNSTWSADGAYWGSPMIYRSMRYPDNGTGYFPFDQYGELMIQGTSHGEHSHHGLYNMGISFLTWDGNSANDPAIRMRIKENGNVGIGTNSPKAKLEITDGDVYVTDTSKGIILTSPGGNCYRITVADDGSLVTTSITCP